MKLNIGPSKKNNFIIGAGISLLLVILVLVFFRKVLFFRGDYIIQGIDLIQTYYPKLLYKASLLQFKFPLWNPYIYSGYPFLAHPYNGVFYPLNLLFLVMPINVAYSWILTLHVFLAGLFMFLLVHYLVKDRWAAFLSAVAFMFSGFMISRVWAGHFELFTTSIWIPLVFLFFLITLEKKSFLFAVLTAIVLAIQFFAGHNQTFFFSALILLIYFIFSCFQDSIVLLRGLRNHGGAVARKPEVEAALRSVSRNFILFISVALFFAIFSAIQLLPTAELTRLSTRSSGVQFFKSAYGSFPPDQLIRFFFPNFFGDILKTGYPGDPILGEIHWEFTYYIGIIPLILAINSVRMGLNKRTKRILLLVVVVIFVLSILTRFIFLQLWGIRSHPAMAGPSLLKLVNFLEMVYSGKLSMWRILPFFLALLLISLLIFWGFKRRLIDTIKIGNKNDRMILFFAVLAIIGAILAFGHYSGGLYYFLYKFFPGYNKFKWPSRHLIITSFSLCVLAGYSMSRQVKLKTYVKFILIGLVFLDLFWYGHRYLYLRNLNIFYPPKNIVKRLESDRELFRILTFPVVKPGCVYEPSCSEFQANAGVPLQISNVTGYDPLILSRYHQLTNVLQNLPLDEFGDVAVRVRNLSNINLLKLLNVKYIFTDKDFAKYKLDMSSFDIVEKTDNGFLLLFKGHLPRFMFIKNATVAVERSDLISKISSKDFSPDKNVILEAAQSPIISASKTNAGDNHNIKVLTYHPEEINLEVNTQQDGYLVASEVYYPGWKAFINGKEAEIYRSNYSFRSVFLPSAGRFILQFRFEPVSLKLGVLISLLGFSFIIFYFIIHFCIWVIRFGK